MKPSLSDIPRGNTSPGVNRAVIEYLASLDDDLAGESLLDLPCGNGEFLDTIKRFFPECKTIGADIVKPTGFEHEFYRFDAEKGSGLETVENCKVVTCISGVMEFDNTLRFLQTVGSISDNGAKLIVTNDNLTTVRDRLLYFLFGRFRQYKTTPRDDRATWKIIHLNNLIHILRDAGFTVSDIRYVIAGWTEWLWLPLALPMYVLQLIYFITNEPDVPLAEKRKFLPFASMLARHYFLICEKKTESADETSPEGMK